MLTSLTIKWPLIILGGLIIIGICLTLAYVFGVCDSPSECFFILLTHLLVYVLGLLVGLSPMGRPRGGSGLVDMIP